MRHRALLFILIPLVFVSASTRADTIEILEDYNQQVVGSDSAGPFGESRRSVSLGSKVYFEAATGNVDVGLWVTDGTVAGTRSIAGLEKQRFVDLAAVGNHVVAMTYTESSTADLWIIDSITDEVEYVTAVDGFGFFGFEQDRSLVSYTEEQVVIRTQGERIFVFDVNARSLAALDMATRADGGQAFTAGGAYVYTARPSSEVVQLLAKDLGSGEETILQESLAGPISGFLAHAGDTYFTVGVTPKKLWKTSGSLADTEALGVSNITGLHGVAGQLLVATSETIYVFPANAGNMTPVTMPEQYYPVPSGEKWFWDTEEGVYFLCADGPVTGGVSICRTDLVERAEVVIEGFSGELFADQGSLYLVSESEGRSVIERFEGDSGLRQVVLDGRENDDMLITSWLHPDAPLLVNANDWFYGTEPRRLQLAAGEALLLANINPVVQTADAKGGLLAATTGRAHVKLCCKLSSLESDNFQTVTASGISQRKPPASVDIGFLAVKGAKGRFDFYDDSYGRYRHAFGVTNVIADVESKREYTLPYYGFPTSSTVILDQRLPEEGDFVYLVDLDATLPVAPQKPALLFRSTDGDQFSLLERRAIGMIDHRDGFLLFGSTDSYDYYYSHYVGREAVTEFAPCTGQSCNYPRWFGDGEGTFIGHGDHPGQEELLSAEHLYYYDERFSPIPRAIDLSPDGITALSFVASFPEWTLFAVEKPGLLRLELYRIEHRTLAFERLFGDVNLSHFTKVGARFVLHSRDRLYFFDRQFRLQAEVDLNQHFGVPETNGAFFACHLGYCYVSGFMDEFARQKALLKVNAGNPRDLQIVEPSSRPEAPLTTDGDSILLWAGHPLFGSELHKLSVESRDADGDGIYDAVEETSGLDPASAVDAGQDMDGDGLSNLREFRLGTAMDVADSDRDGLPDGVEVEMGFDPQVYDTHLHDEDGDGLSFRQERRLGTDYQAADSDGDGVDDGADVFPTDSSEWADDNQNGIGDNAEQDSAPALDNSGSGGGQGGGGAFGGVALLLLLIVSIMRSRPDGGAAGRRVSAG